MPETQAQTTGAESAAPPQVPVTVTAKAVKMVNITKEEEGHGPSCGLRIAVRGGGCSGVESALDFDEESRDTDLVYEQNGLKVIVDPISARYLAGTEIDSVLGMTGAGFKVSNPNAVGTCGCGSSFTV